MKINIIKQQGGVMVPVDDTECERMKRFKSGEQYEVEIKLTRSPAFHRKVWSFFGFCYNYWCAEGTNWEMLSDNAQRNVFRKNLTVLAGYYEEHQKIGGGVRVEAKSLAYSNMEQEEFEQCYNALINAAIKHVFGNTKDQNVINQLYAFF